MSLIIKPKTGLLFMKVGLHSGETFEDILERKQREYERAGMIFWGYGGGTCHPTRHVQPFARLRIEEGDEVYIVMEEIDSRHPPTEIVASQYSEDGIHWKQIPDGIEVRGSRYAVVMEELKEGDLEIDLCQYEVAAGPSIGRAADGYISGRVDKACLVQSEEIQAKGVNQIKRISHYAKLKSPYAVFTK
jgi:hypothetical protein